MTWEKLFDRGYPISESLRLLCTTAAYSAIMTLRIQNSHANNFKY